MINGEHGQILIPFVFNYIEAVDAEGKTITADWGLDY
jgi:ribosome maturation factor rimM